MNALLLSLPGTPVVYYGDEIGMGDNIYLGDRNGVRTPMQWSADRNAGFSRANPQQLYLPPVIDPGLLLRDGQRRDPAEQPALAAVVDEAADRPAEALQGLRPRQRWSSCTRPTPRCWPSSGATRTRGSWSSANLSRHAQFVELDLSEFREMVPVELFGQTDFPRIGELPYLLTLAPHAFYWFALEERGSASLEEETGGAERRRCPPSRCSRAGRTSSADGARPSSRRSCPPSSGPGAGSGARRGRIKGAEILDAIPVPVGRGTAFLTLVQVEYAEGDPDTYVVTLGLRDRRAGGPASWSTSGTRWWRTCG